MNDAPMETTTLQHFKHLALSAVIGGGGLGVLSVGALNEWVKLLVGLLTAAVLAVRLVFMLTKRDRKTKDKDQEP
jgi:ABC-type proline/glycine betaine transport system permease subunit